MRCTFRELFNIFAEKEESPELTKSDAYMFRYLLRAACWSCGALVAYIGTGLHIEFAPLSIISYIVLSLICGALAQLYVFALFTVFTVFIHDMPFAKLCFLVPSLLVLVYALTR